MFTFRITFLDLSIEDVVADYYEKSGDGEYAILNVVSITEDGIEDFVFTCYMDVIKCIKRLPVTLIN